MLAFLSSAALGFFLGMRHALDPDHLAAVSTLVADRPHRGSATRLGAFWGLGHAVSLFLVGGILLALRAELAPWLADVLELGVAVVLVGLGAQSLYRAARPRATRRQPGIQRPLLIGVAHGIAGSGAVAALIMASMPSVASALVYMLLFGVGSLVGMSLMTGFAGLSLRRLVGDREDWPALMGMAGACSLLVGVVWAWPLAARLIAAVD